MLGWVLTVLIATGGIVPAPCAASALAAPVALGTAANFAVLGGASVTNIGPTIVTGDLGTSPTPAVTGFPPGTLIGTLHVADTAAAQAQADLLIAYNDAVSRTPGATIPTQLGGTTVTPGVYNSAAGTFQITGNLTLDAQGDPNAVFIFQTASTLITAAASTVTLTGGAQACNVFWQVGSSATLGATTDFAGDILALTSITVGSGVTVDGRTLAHNGTVSLDANTITLSTCAGPPDRSTTTTVNSSCAISQQSPITFTAAVRSPSGIVPTGPVEFFSDGVSLGTAQLDGTGHAELTVAPLSEGVHEIVAVFPGVTELDGSTSPAFIQAVDSQGFCLLEECGPTCGSQPQAKLLSTTAKRMTCPPRQPSANAVAADKL
ncbi:ice-binding family protein [Streptosporangium sp. NBC_01756]|uniref:ice-binding family protein n=1 Tax=Streptosporangium sp. NBC_01756 TaxID=2975950 RepID=UPI002DDBD24E|nr:ice-binding family protein [Streptosporangium sp. NBC_01756]WSC86678.1 ice-binding family protein [Streptosporangium sp. NBC_01756]